MLSVDTIILNRALVIVHWYRTKEMLKAGYLYQAVLCLKNTAYIMCIGTYVHRLEVC